MEDKFELMQFIVDNLEKRTLLEQLAEESAELSQAALKLIRAEGLSENPTPVNFFDACDNLREEFLDVVGVFYLTFGFLPAKEMVLESPKWERWAKRIAER